MTESAGYSGVTPEGAPYTGSAAVESSTTGRAPVVGYTGITATGEGYTGTAPSSGPLPAASESTSGYRTVTAGTSSSNAAEISGQPWGAGADQGPVGSVEQGRAFEGWQFGDVVGGDLTDALGERPNNESLVALPTSPYDQVLSYGQPEQLAESMTIDELRSAGLLRDALKAVRTDPSRQWTVKELEDLHGARLPTDIYHDANLVNSYGEDPSKASIISDTLTALGYSATSYSSYQLAGGLAAAIFKPERLASPKIEPPAALSSPPKRIYSSQELVRAAQDPLFHEFPVLLDDAVFAGERIVISRSYILYRARGIVVGGAGRKVVNNAGEVLGRKAFENQNKVYSGWYEIGVRPQNAGKVEVVVHRLFRRD